MTQICTTTTQLVLVAGTGGEFPVPDRNWRASARSTSRVARNGAWRYSFVPRQGSVFITGLFDDVVFDVPDPAAYIVAVEYDRNRFAVRYNGAHSAFFPHLTGQRVALARTAAGRYIVYCDRVEVWRSP